MSMTVKKFRLSFIQMETLVVPLAALTTPVIPYDFLLSDAKYPRQYAAALAGSGPHRPPWRDDMGKMYWFDYFGRSTASGRSVRDVWQGLAPLETPSASLTPAAGTPGTIEVRTYLYPWGIAAIADITVQGTWALPQAVAQAFQLRRKLSYQVTVSGTAKTLPLLPALNEVIAGVRTTAYGTGIPSVRGETFSIVSVLDGDGVDIVQPISEEIQKALAGLTSWNDDWIAIKPDDLKLSSIRIRKSPDSHALYASKRGRAVWFPAGFETATGSTQRLNCYHNNLLMATLQTDSLCRLCAAAAQQLANGEKKKDWSQTYRNCVRIAAGLLGRIYGGNETYRTRSAKELIKTYRQVIDAARKDFGMDPLNQKAQTAAAATPSPSANTAPNQNPASKPNP